MKSLKVFCIGVALAGAGILAFNAPPLQGQTVRARQNAAEALILKGPGSSIGVTVHDPEPAGAAQPGGAAGGTATAGVVIDTVRPDSPAATAGLREDDVVVEFDGERVRSARQFARLVEETPPGRTVNTVVMRGGQRTELRVTPEGGGRRIVRIDPGRVRADVDRMMERLPQFDVDLAIDPVFGVRGRLGATVHELTPDLAAYFGAKDGVLVATVRSDSAASRAGLKVGDVITSVNGDAIGSSRELQRVLRDQRDATPLTLGLVRDKKEMTVTVEGR